MGVTVGVNNLSVVHKPGNGVTIAFPDVCKTNIGGGPVPIPYPNFAKTATENRKDSSKKQAPTKTSSTKKTAVRGKSVSGLDLTMSNSAAVGSKQMEIQQLRMRMNSLHHQITNLQSSNPDKWQKLLEDYSVAASALYMTKTPD